MPQFVPDQTVFGDAVGAGYWDTAHYREHQQFVSVLAGKSPPVLLANYDFLQMLSAGADRRYVIESHQEAHELLANILGLTNTDYGQFNLDSQDDFYSFLGYHSSDHAQIRQALGIT